MFCSKCGAEAGPDARFCSKCGNALQAADPGPPDRGDIEYVEAAIGPRNTDYYLRKFERFGSSGGYVSWNWPAFFVPLLWMLYRKMWLWAALYFFATPFVFSRTGMATTSTSSTPTPSSAPTDSPQRPTTGCRCGARPASRSPARRPPGSGSPTSFANAETAEAAR